MAHHIIATVQANLEQHCMEFMNDPEISCITSNEDLARICCTIPQTVIGKIMVSYLDPHSS